MGRLAVPVLAATMLVLLADPATGQRGGRGRFALDVSSSVVVFPTPGIADFDVGWIDHPGLAVVVQSRPPKESWELRLRATGVDMGGYGKPVEDLLWRVDGTGWMPLTNGDQVVLRGQGDRAITVYFRLRLGWETDVPDTYSVGILFSATRI